MFLSFRCGLYKDIKGGLIIYTHHYVPSHKMLIFKWVAQIIYWFWNLIKKIILWHWKIKLLNCNDKLFWKAQNEPTLMLAHQCVGQMVCGQTLVWIKIFLVNDDYELVVGYA